jgi:NADH-quinone oxidoreductase subunit N
MNPPSALAVAQQTAQILIPEFLLLFTAMGMMTASAFVKRPRREWCAASAIAMAVALLVLIAQAAIQTDLYSAVALNDDLSYFARILLLITGLIVLGLAHEEPSDERAGEFFGALLMINAGAMLVAAANELVFLFVGLELVSMPTYLLLYLARRNRATQEAATKYFFLSIFASGLLLYGLTFLYGTTGISNLKALAYLTSRSPGIPQLQDIPQLQLGSLALVFVLAGLCFRVAAVPMHFYAPDVYQGSSIVIAAFLSWVPKVVGFLAIIRTLIAVVSLGNEALVQKAILLAWIIAAATMIWGNFVALLQEDLKRLLAYSSIAHAGYLMVGVAAAFANDRGGGVYYGSESIFFYLVVYGFMNLGAFGVISALKINGRVVEKVDDLAGLAWSKPLPALCLSICLLSLSGIPPLAGFWGKFEIFAAALAAQRRDETGSFLLLAIIGMLSAAVGAYYYLRLVVVMYFRPAGEPIEVRGGWPVTLAWAACTSLTVVLGLYSTPLAEAAQAAAQAAMSCPDPPRALVAAGAQPRSIGPVLPERD